MFSGEKSIFYLLIFANRYFGTTKTLFTRVGSKFLSQNAIRRTTRAEAILQASMIKVPSRRIYFPNGIFYVPFQIFGNRIVESMLIRFYNFRLFLARWSGKFQKQFASFDPKKTLYSLNSIWSLWIPNVTLATFNQHFTGIGTLRVPLFFNRLFWLKI